MGAPVGNKNAKKPKRFHEAGSRVEVAVHPRRKAAYVKAAARVVNEDGSKGVPLAVFVRETLDAAARELGVDPEPVSKK